MYIFGIGGALGLGAKKMVESKLAGEGESIRQRAQIEKAQKASAKQVEAKRRETQNAAFSNSLAKVKATYFSNAPLTARQRNALNGLMDVAQSSGVSPVISLRTLQLHTGTISRPNYKNLSMKEKFEVLGTKDPKVFNVCTAFLGQPSEVRNTIREMCNAPGMQTRVYSLAEAERTQRYK